MIRERKWNVFAAQPKPAVESLVREFYANAIAAKHDIVMVRGKEVSFSAAAINEYYDMGTVPVIDEYLQYKLNELDLEEVIRGLCRPEATWKFNGKDPVLFAANHLSRFGKAWHFFICAKLMPTTHVSDIIRERAILLYCLVKGKTINVGSVIRNSIQHAIDGGSTSGLPHPSLICGLCAWADVTWDNNEPTIQPKVLIDERIIRHLKQWDGAPADPRGAGFILNPPATEEAHSPDTEELFAASPSNPSQEAGTSTTAPISEYAFRMQMNSLQSSMDSQFRTIARQNRRLAQRQDALYSYNTSFNTALVAMFERLQPGQDTSQFPTPQPLPAYPPPDSDDEAGDGAE